GGWVAPHWDEDMGPFESLIMGEYDLLLGKRTYDIFSAYWPYNRDNPIGEKFQRINKYVLTHSDEPLTWDNSHRLSGNAADAVAELKKSEGRDLLIQGSSTLYPPLLSARAIDRLTLITFPIVLGQGKRLFDGSEKPSALNLVEHFVSPRGVVITTYEPAGEVPTGSFARTPARKSWSGGARSRRGPGDAGAVRSPFLVLHVESAYPALRGPDRVPVSAGSRERGELRGTQADLAVRQIPAAPRRRESGDRDDLHHRTSPGASPWIQHVDSGWRTRPPGALPRPLLRPPRPGQHAARGEPRAAARRKRRPLWRGAGAQEPAGGVRLARGEPARWRLGSRRHLHACRLRSGTGALLCRLGRGDRRWTAEAEGLPRPVARASGGGAGRRRGAAVPAVFPAGRSRPRLGEGGRLPQ